MNSTVKNFKESNHLNKFFSYFIIYYWGWFYLLASYIIVILPISIFIVYGITIIVAVFFILEFIIAIKMDKFFLKKEYRN